MDYIDLNGELVKNQSGQDKLLAFLYTNMAGRVLLKPLVMPWVSVMGGRLLSGKLSTIPIKRFIQKNHIDMSDYENRNYQSFNDFFTRKIIPEKRPVNNQALMVSPSDGKVTVYPIQKDLSLKIKNTSYHLSELLKNEKLTQCFEGGYAYIVRLSVDDYHRYIYPVSGSKTKNYHINGVFHTVNPVANDFYPIYKENTREYTILHTKNNGNVLMMEVGALMVGKITNHHEKRVVMRGEEKGYFEFGGSTIVVLTEKKMGEPRQDLLWNTGDGYETKILQGQALTER